MTIQILIRLFKVIYIVLNLKVSLSKIFENFSSSIFQFQFRFIIEYFVSDERSRRDVHAKVLDCPSGRVLSKRANLQARPGNFSQSKTSNIYFIDILPKTRDIGSFATFIAGYSDICRGLSS